MKWRTIAGLYAIAVSIFMFWIWMYFAITNTVPFYEERPLEMSLHIAAEMMTCMALLAGGIGLLKSISWGRSVYFLGMGMLAYALVNSPGMYVESGMTLMAAVFPPSLIVAVVFIVVPLIKTAKGDF